MRSMPSRNAPASLSPSPCRTTISADRAGVGAIARGLVRLVLSAALLCLISLPSTARAQTCGLVTACCFSQQPASFVACEQVSQNHAFTFTAVFHGGRSSEWNTTYQWYKRVNGVETPVGGMEWGWTANYTIYGWSPTEVGDYRCQFFEQVEPYGGPDEFSYPDGIACGVFYSNYGSYAVTPTVRVAGVPADDQMKCAGDAVTFTMQVSG